jgi:hypothetical protein
MAQAAMAAVVEVLQLTAFQITLTAQQILVVAVAAKKVLAQMETADLELSL